jgi:hypothetical protein
MKKTFLIILLVLFYCLSANAQEINLPNTGAFGKIQGGDETHVNEVIYKIPYDVMGDYVLTFEVWDMDVAEEIKVYINDQEVFVVPVIGNEIWSTTQTVKIPDIRLCDDNKENKIKFDNTDNPPGTQWWGVRNVQLIKDKPPVNITLYQETTDQDITVAWDDTNDREKYPQIFFDFFTWNIGEEKKYLIGRTQLLQATFKLPRTGLYIFYGRACDKPYTDETRVCSQWGHSALTNLDGTPFGRVEDPNNPGQFIPGNWMLYGHIAAPTGGGVD